MLNRFATLQARRQAPHTLACFFVALGPILKVTAVIRLLAADAVHLRARAAREVLL